MSCHFKFSSKRSFGAHDMFGEAKRFYIAFKYTIINKKMLRHV